MVRMMVVKVDPRAPKKIGPMHSGRWLVCVRYESYSIARARFVIREGNSSSFVVSGSVLRARTALQDTYRMRSCWWSRGGSNS